MNAGPSIHQKVSLSHKETGGDHKEEDTSKLIECKINCLLSKINQYLFSIRDNLCKALTVQCI